MSDQKHWAQFWFKNYEGDVRLRLCSLAAQGLWMRMLCYMHEAKRFGYLDQDEKDLAKLTGTEEAVICTLLKELETREVFSRAECGTIYCRRMVRTTEISDVRAAAGRARHQKSAPVQQDSGGAQASKTSAKTQQNVSKPISKNSAKSLSEDNKIESIIPSPSETGQEPELPSIRQTLWRDGPAIMRDLTGQPPTSARAFLGKLLSELRDDCAVAMAILREAQAQRPIDPQAWLMRAAQARAAPPSTKTGSARERAMASLMGLDGPEKTQNDVVQTIDSEVLGEE